MARHHPHRGKHSSISDRCATIPRAFDGRGHHLSAPLSVLLGRRRYGAITPCLALSDPKEHEMKEEFDLPITPLLPKLVDSLEEVPNLVLQAPPGAGKTTSVPLALLRDATWLRDTDKTILVLEPRRIAARSAAVRMASALGEQVGMTVGFRVRQESKVSPRTRIVCVTEGMLL